MAQCFCGCGRKIKFRMRPVNLRARQLRADVREIENLLQAGMRSPHGEAYVELGLMWCSLLAEAVHRGELSRVGFSDAFTNWDQEARRVVGAKPLGEALLASGMDREEFLAAVCNGELDPFAHGAVPPFPEPPDPLGE